MKHKRFCRFTLTQIVLQLEQTLSCLNTFHGDQIQKQNLQMLLQLIGVPISAIFSLPLFCQHVYCKRSYGASRSSTFSTELPNPTLVQSNFELNSTRTSNLQTQCIKFEIITRSQSQIPKTRKNVTDCGSIIHGKYRKLGYSENTRNILLASWRPGTLKTTRNT